MPTIDFYISEQSVFEALDNGARLYIEAPYLGSQKTFILWSGLPSREICGPAVWQMINDGKLVLEPYSDSNMNKSRYLWVTRLQSQANSEV